MPHCEQGSVAIQAGGKIYTARYRAADGQLSVTVPSGKTRSIRRNNGPAEPAAEEVLRELVRDGQAG
jgi:hypothetical protein